MILGLFGGAALAASAWVALAPAPGVTLVLSGHEYQVGDPQSSQAQARVSEALELRSRQILREEIFLRADEVMLSGTAEEWGYRVDLQRAHEEAMLGISEAHVSPTEHLGVWLLRRFSSKREAYPLDLTFDFDETVAQERLEQLAAHVEREAVDAQMLIAEHRIVPSREGRTLSVGATVVRMRAEGAAHDTLIEAAVTRVSPRVTEDELAPVDVSRVLAEYETSFRGKAGSRAVNIRAAARFLDGAIVLPGEVLSFNDQVGRRIHARGFVDAPVIVNDEMEVDVGGGVCQVATTLHAAAVFGNMEIVRRRSHSRPSGYAPLGLDATVLDGKVDLQIRNPFDEPILVHVSFPSPYVIRVELLGRDPDAQVEHAYAVTHREPFARRVWRKEEAPLGGFEMKQKGSEGMDVVSVLRIKHEDGRLDRRSYRSKYYPVPEVFWIGEEASPAELPALPKEAVGLVIDGEEVSSAPTEETVEDVPSLDRADGSDQERKRLRDMN